MIHLILLSGGSGTRLWPLSNNARSKQFLKVLRDEDGNHISMVQRVYSQIQNVDVTQGIDVTIATTDSQRYSIESQLPEGGYALVLEPERRDTAPAIMLACMHLQSEQHANADDTVVVMPIDTFADQEYYDKVVKLDEAVQAGQSDLILLGVEPTYASSKYGYIVPANHDSEPWPVSEFQEKPDEGSAALLIENGALWNCGVFAFKLSYITAITRRYTDAPSYEQLQVCYAELPKNSFDYEVVETANRVSVVPYSGTWKDLGTWNTLCEEMSEATAGRVIGVRSTCKNTHVINELGIPMVTSGLKDVVVVATHDGILVSEKDASSHMKPLVERVAENRPMYEQRRWGHYRVLDSNVYNDGTRSLVKELIIDSAKQLSYQLHKHRREVWTITTGTGEVVLDGEVRQVKTGSVIDIPLGVKHACRAFEQIKLVEVQLGDELDEQDIERFGDFWESAEGEAL